MRHGFLPRNRYRFQPGASPCSAVWTLHSFAPGDRRPPPVRHRKSTAPRRRRWRRFHSEHMPPWPVFGRTSPCRAPGAWSCRGCTWTRLRQDCFFHTCCKAPLRPRQAACARCGSGRTGGATRPGVRRRAFPSSCRHGISPWPPRGVSRRSHGSLSVPGPAGAGRIFCRAPPRPSGPSSGDSAAVPPPLTSPDTCAACPRPSVFHCVSCPWPVFSLHKVHRSCGRAPAGQFHMTNSGRRPASHPSSPGTAPDSCAFRLPDPRTCPISP